MIRKLSLLAAAALLAAGASHAASDGTASTTSSTGSFTNTIGSVSAPQVRVFGLQDSIFTTSTGSSVNSFWGPFPRGVENGFCVAHSTGGNVQLSFSSPNYGQGGDTSAPAAVAGSGAKLNYYTSVFVNSTHSTILHGGANTVTVTGAQTDLLTCASPNVTKTVLLAGGGEAPTDAVYTDVVTVIATPL